MELLIAVLLFSGMVTKVIQDGRTDRAYAAKGQVSPRHQVRLARLAKAGRPASPKGRGPLRNYLSELYADAILDRQEKHRARRAARPPYVYDPDTPKLRRRFGAWVSGRAAAFDEAALAGLDRVRQSKGWRGFVDPVGEPRTPGAPLTEDQPPADPEAVGEAPAEEVRLPGSYTPPRVGDRYVDEYNGRVLEWAGDVWAPVCSRCDVPMSVRDNAGWLACGTCGVRFVAGFFDPAHLTDDPDEDMLVRTGGCPYLVVAGRDPAHYCASNRSPNDGDHPYCRSHAASIRDDRGRGGYVAPAGDVDDHLPLEPITTTTGGTPMTTAVGEAANYETAVVATGELATATQNLSDHVAGAVAAADTFQAHVEEIDGAKRDVQDALASVMEQLGSKRVDSETMSRISAALELIHANDLSAALDQIEGAKNALSSTQAGAAEASGAVSGAQDSLVSTYGDAHATMAEHGTAGDFIAV